MEGLPDRNDLAWWFPRLEASGVRVPKTALVNFAGDLTPMLDGEVPAGFAGFVKRLREAAGAVGGWPVFLRTGHGSGKQQWGETCFVASARDLPQHIYRLVEWSNTVDVLGLPTQNWAVREFLALRHQFTAFTGMPVAREFRFFLRDGEVVCWHFYWPAGSIRGASLPDGDWQAALAEAGVLAAAEEAQLRALAGRAARAFPGWWSLDLAQCEDGGWVAIDMAEGARSWHWPGCAQGMRPV